jgi:hypothetical protein
MEVYEYNIRIISAPSSIFGLYDWVHAAEVLEAVEPDTVLSIGTDDQIHAQMVRASIETLEIAVTMGMMHALGAVGIIFAYAQNLGCYVKLNKE